MNFKPGVVAYNVNLMIITLKLVIIKLLINVIINIHLILLEIVDNIIIWPMAITF